MMFSKRLRELREKTGKPQEQAADEVGIPRSSWANYESDDNTRLPRQQRLERIADYYNVSVDYLLGRTDVRINEDDKLRKIKMSSLLANSQNKLQKILAKTRTPEPKLQEETEFVRIPVYGEIKAGYDHVAEQNIIGYEVASKNDVSDGDYFYLKVKGDSMIDARIKDGDFVLVRKQSFVKDGGIGVVIVNGEEATLKRLHYSGNNIILQAANADIPPKVLPIKEVLIQGQVKRVVFEV